MKLFKKKNLIKFFSIPIVGIMIALPLSSCTSYNNHFINNGNVDNNNNNDDSDNSPSTEKATLDTNISNSKLIDSKVSVVEKNANDFGLTQNFNDFAENGDFTKYKGINSNNEIKDDILGYLSYLFYSNKKSFSITNAEVSELSISNIIDKTKSDNNDLVFNQSKISFKLTATIKSVNSTQLNIEGKTYNLGKGSSTTLIIESKDQSINPIVQKYGNKFYLGWKIKNANLSLSGINNDIVLTNFCPTINSFSKAFYIEFNDLSDKQTYFDLKNKYEKDFENSVTEESMKTLVETKIKNQTSLYFDFADLAKNLVNQIASDQSIDKVIENSTNYIINILISTGIIPQDFENIIQQALEVGSNGKAKTLIQVICDNKNDILKLLKKYLGSAFDIAKPLIENLTPNMTENNPSYVALMGYINQISNLDQTIKDLINKDIFGIGGTPKSLWEILWNNIDTIINKVKSIVGNNTLKGILDIVSLLFEKDDKGDYKSIYDTLLGSDEAKKKFVDKIASMLPNGISEYLNILIINNTSFTKENFKKIINSFASVFNNLFEYNEGKTSKTPYEKRYKNLSISQHWVNTPTINKDNGKITSSFKYQVKVSIIKEVDFDVTPIKKIISPDAFNTLVNKIAKLSGFVSSIANSHVFPKLNELLFNFIPDTIKFGKDGKDNNALIFTYSADNEEVWFNPSKQGVNYYLGFSVGYNTNIFYDDPALWKDIASNEKYIKGTYSTSKSILVFAKAEYNFWYYDFWKSILQNVLMRSYDFNLRFYLSDYKNQIADYSNYDDNYYYTNLVIANNSNSINIDEIKKTFDLTNKENYKDQTSLFTEDQASKSNTLNWGNKTEEVIKGITPVTTNTNLKIMKDKMYSISKNSSFTNLNYNEDFSFNTIFNFSAKMEFQIKITGVVNYDIHPKIISDTSLFYSNLYLPVNFYDTTNKKLVTNISKTYFNLNPTFHM